MLVHTSRVASCQTPGNLFIHARTPCAKKSVCALRVQNPGRVFTRMYGLRCRSGATQVERSVGGGGGIQNRHIGLHSCRVSPISAEVEASSDVDGDHRHSSSTSDFDGEAFHESGALLSSESEVAAQDGEWQSLGSDGGVERLSTPESRGNGLVPSNNNLGTISFGTELETSQSSQWPVDHGGGTAAEERQDKNADGLYNVNGTVLHPEINNVSKEEQDLVVLLGAGSTEEQLALEQQQKIKKRGCFGVRKPSQELSPKIDTAPWISHIKIAERHDELPQPEPQPEIEIAEDFDYYVPKVGDEVTGVVVSGNEYQVDVDIGSRHLARMLLKDLRPFDSFRPEEFFWELDGSGTSMPATSLGQVRFLGDREPLKSTYPLAPVGTVLSMEVHGVTLSGRALLSARKIASRIAWERVRQIQEQDEPVEAQSVAWNSDGLVFKIEGLRALLPLSEFLNRPTTSESVKDYQCLCELSTGRNLHLRDRPIFRSLEVQEVGEWKTVLITDVDEATGRLIVSEKRAWGWRNLRIGSLVVGIVHKVLPFGVDVILTGTSLRAMLHISNISQCYIPDIKSVFTAGDKVKALVIDPGNPHKIGLSTADLESSQGLMLEDKERVFQEAEEMAARLGRNLSTYGSSESEKNCDTPRNFEEPCPANQHWLDFGDGEISMLDTPHKEQEQ